MKHGLIWENGELFYYQNGHPHYAGIIKVDGAIFYIGSDGKALQGQHSIHQKIANGILECGTYTFGEDYKLVNNTYEVPNKINLHRKPSHKRMQKIPFLWYLSRTQKRNFVLGIAAAAFALLLFLCLPHLEQLIHNHKRPISEPTQSTKVMQKISLTTFTEDVLLCSASAKAEYDGKLSLVNAVKDGLPYHSFYFKYIFINASGKLLLSTTSSFESAQEFPMPESNSFVQIDNLFTDTTYFYKVLVDDHEFSGSFHTAPSTRFVSIPGLLNTRDIGGYTTLDGKTVKQGLLIRGVELDGLVNPSFYLPEQDIPTVLDTFGFVYDMDLRHRNVYEGEYSSRLGVPHHFYTSPQYGQIFDPLYANNLKRIFTDLANPDYYPMYLHCTWGRDRTGTIVFLLQGILNMSEEDMVREYRLSAYHQRSLAESSNMNSVIEGMASYEGNTLQERIVTYLTTVIGITDEQIASIREIFLED